MKILISGGAGYIGSLIAGSLRRAGHQPVILDSLTGGRRDFTDPYPLYEIDLGDRRALGALWEKESRRRGGEIDGIIHCAAKTIVPESAALPGLYYGENVVKSLAFYETLEELGCTRIILSGSASVYGNSREQLLTEKCPVNPGSPYARTKLIQEQMLADLCRRSEGSGLRGLTLRYFNPLGAAEDLSTGPWKRKGSHLIAKLMEHSRENPFTLTGTDFPTRDGTGLRDYFHVADLARAHVIAMEKFDSLFDETRSEYQIMNAGSGQGITVNEFINAFERVSGRTIDYITAPPRPGDVSGGFASIEKINRLLGWVPRYTLDEAIKSALDWESQERTMAEI